MPLDVAFVDADAESAPVTGDATPRLLPDGTARRLSVLLVGGFWAFLAWPRVYEEPGLCWVFVVGGLGMAGLLWFGSRGPGTEVEWRPRRAHGLQVLAQGAVFAYWGWHHPPVYDQLPLVGAQILFAYALDVCLAWRRFGRYRLGFAPWPVVGSINLFLWMTDAWFAVQLLMVAVAYLARDFVQWERGGRRVHVFNPSALALSVVALVLVIGGWTDLARGREIAATLGSGAHCYDAILLAGLVVQLAFPVVLTTLAALGTTVLLGLAYAGATGVFHSLDTAVPVAVFLGMTLLVTDPATSPRDNTGKLLFGVLYGVGVFFTFDLLNLWSGAPWGPQISYFDKLLCVPLLNLLVPVVERLTRRLALPEHNLAHVGLYVGLFLLVRGQLVDHPGRSVALWREACAAERPGACDRLVMSFRARCLGPGADPGCAGAKPLVLRAGCDAGVTASCGALGLGLSQSEPERAEPLLETACTAGHAASCEPLAMMRFGRRDPPHRYLPALERACEGGFQTACGTLGFVYAAGQGVGVDLVRARRLLGRACGAQVEPACKLLQRLGPREADGQ